MRDNNLDDLIIDNMESKSNSGLKNLLSILALIIIILIVAILLTKIILKEPQEEKMVFDQNYTQMANPELQPTTQDNKTLASEQLSTIVEEEVQSVQSIQETNQTQVAPETIAPIKESQPKTPEPTKPITQQPVAPKPVAQQPATPKPTEPKPVAAELPAYYVQVGSFTSQPSQNFLNVIKNHGYNYTIKQTTAGGTTTSKLLIGPYKGREEAQNALAGIRDRINKGAFLVLP